MKQEPVRSEEGRNMAEKIGAVGYLECSAKTKEGKRRAHFTRFDATRPFASRCTRSLRTCRTRCSRSKEETQRWLCDDLRRQWPHGSSLGV